jgi:hypothetical protein
VLEQAHVAAVKGNMEATIAQAMLIEGTEPGLELGKIGYVFDARRLQRDAEDDLAAFDASRMDYFHELRNATGATVTPMNSASIGTRDDLDQFDSIVLADEAIPPDAGGQAFDRASYIAALDNYARDGGQLVLTDGALNFLVDLGLFTSTDIKYIRSAAGYVDFGEKNHVWEQGLTGVPRQTYYAVPLGYDSDGGEAPQWGVASAAWTAKGGVTAGTMSSGATVNLGELPHGDGSIAIFGAILPTQQPGVVGAEAPRGMSSVQRIDHGLADYAISVAGGTILHAILGFERGNTVGITIGGGSPEPAVAHRTTTELHNR